MPLKQQPRKKGRGFFGKDRNSVFKVQSNDNGGETISLSKKDQQVKATLASIKCIFDENHHVANMMNDLATEAKDWAVSTPPSKRSLTKLSKNLNLCKSVLDRSSNVMLKSIELTSPLAGMVPLFKRQEVARKGTKALSNLDTRKSTSQKHLERIHSQYSDAPKNSTSISYTVKNSIRKANKNQTSQTK